MADAIMPQELVRAHGRPWGVAAGQAQPD